MLVAALYPEFLRDDGLVNFALPLAILYRGGVFAVPTVRHNLNMVMANVLHGTHIAHPIVALFANLVGNVFCGNDVQSLVAIFNSNLRSHGIHCMR